MRRKAALKAVPVSVERLAGRLAKVGIFTDFYLADGTGLALLLSHRRSVDLDFFSRTNRLRFQERRRLLSLLKSFSDWKLTEAQDGTVHGRVGTVRLSFFWYAEPLVRPVNRKGPIRIASLEDIGLMKLAAIIGRGSRKDFLDLYEICRIVPLSKLFRMARRKFKAGRNFTLQALKALCFFEDAQREPPVMMVIPVSWEQVKSFFIRQAQSLLQQDLRG